MPTAGRHNVSFFCRLLPPSCRDLNAYDPARYLPPTDVALRHTLNSACTCGRSRPPALSLCVAPNRTHQIPQSSRKAKKNIFMPNDVKKRSGGIDCPLEQWTQTIGSLNPNSFSQQKFKSGHGARKFSPQPSTHLHLQCKTRQMVYSLW